LEENVGRSSGVKASEANISVKLAIFGEIFHRALIIIYAEKRKISMKER